jgi:hypothetical protein
VDGPRIDLVRQAILSHCTGDFAWINARQELLACGRHNHGFTAIEIRELAKAWVEGGGEIYCRRETREEYRSWRDYYYFVVIGEIDEFPHGLFIEMELTDPDSDNPLVSILNAHESSFS